jgi:hypothetical protein
MTAFERYFDRIFVINLESRPDRWKHFLAEMEKIGCTKFERFEGYNRPFDNGRASGNSGCVASHRGVLELIAHNKWERALVLEDDIEFIDPNSKYAGPTDFNALWESIEPRIPVEWDMLYLGGHYGSDPVSRLSPNIIRFGTMLTTSSYAVTWRMARRMCPYIFGGGPIDSLYGFFHEEPYLPNPLDPNKPTPTFGNRCYIVQPRLFAQYTNVSDLQDREMNNRLCMTDRRHESMMPSSYVGALKDYVPPPPRITAGKVMNPDQFKEKT